MGREPTVGDVANGRPAWVTVDPAPGYPVSKADHGPAGARDQEATGGTPLTSG